MGDHITISKVIHDVECTVLPDLNSTVGNELPNYIEFFRSKPSIENFITVTPND